MNNNTKGFRPKRFVELIGKAIKDIRCINDTDGIEIELEDGSGISCLYCDVRGQIIRTFRDPESEYVFQWRGRIDLKDRTGEPFVSIRDEVDRCITSKRCYEETGLEIIRSVKADKGTYFTFRQTRVYPPDWDEPEPVIIDIDVYRENMNLDGITNA